MSEIILEMQHNAEGHTLPTGAALHSHATELYPILRSISGAGVETTLAYLRAYLCPTMRVVEVATGTEVHDWVVPKEWNCRAAWLKAPDGTKVVDLADHTLHILNYSVPMQGSFTYDELLPHLFSLPAQPDLIPYRTSYYNANWGFCLPHNQLEQLPKDGLYEVYIDSSLLDGNLTYGEVYIPGQSTEEVLISTHICHPSLADDNLSSMVVAAALAGHLAEMEGLKYSYRIVFVPGTIGAISFLAQTHGLAQRVRFGLVLSLLGQRLPFHYKASEAGQTTTDLSTLRTLAQLQKPFDLIDFYPYGYDERQYNSAGYRMPVGRLSRALHGQFAQYHTSADNLSLISAEALEESLEVLLAILKGYEAEVFYRNSQPFGEPQLGKRGLYRAISGNNQGTKMAEMAMLWLLNQSDGHHSMADISQRSGIEMPELEQVASKLVAAGLLMQI